MSKSKGAGVVRIISGRWRGKKLPVANVPGLRPTGDRMRETLFNWLQGEIDGGHCLDLFSGAGSLGFEALSRYAGHVTLIEKHKQVARHLEQQLRQLDPQAGKVVCADAIQFLQKPAQPQQLVFVDPPFHQGLVERVVPLLQNGWLAEDGWVYIETERELAFDVPSNWQLYREKNMGMVACRLYQVSSS